MLCNPAKTIFHLNLLAAAALAAGAASAADLYGGGATFPVQSYVGNDFLNHFPWTRLSRNTVNTVTTTPIATLTPPDTVFARFSASTGHRTSYCQSGSGTGLSLLTGVGSGSNPVTNAAGECGNYSASLLGFSAPGVVPDYIGTDIPINQANITAFSGGPRAARGTMWQIPTLAGAVALAHHAGLNGVLNLSTQQICHIFSGTISNWSQIPGSGSEAPIQIVHRPDSNGTTFAVTGWLARSCNDNFGIHWNYFSANPLFTGGVPIGPLAGRLVVTPALGETGMVAVVRATTNSIGYAAYPEVATQGAAFASVNGLSPASFGGPGSPVVNIPAGSLLQGQVLNAANATVPATGLTLANANCLRLIPPGTPAAAGSYPILAYTYLAGYRINTAANRDALRSLMGHFLGTQRNNRPPPPAGFAYLDGVGAYRTSIQATINNCIL